MTLITIGASWRRAALAAGAGIGAAVLLVPATAAVAVVAPAFLPAVPVQLPVTAATPPVGSLSAVACTGTGTCVAGGYYHQKGGPTEAMVAAQSGGTWSRAARLTLPSNAAALPYASINGMACVTAGSCVAVGQYYEAKASYDAAFAAVESGGKWRQAIAPKLPGNAMTGTGAFAALTSAACTSSGYCEAAGLYLDKGTTIQQMVIARPAGGSWGQAAEISAPANAKKPNPNAALYSISCSSAGNCVAVGQYQAGGSGASQAMGVIQVNGKWGRAVGIAPPAGAAANPRAVLDGVSCGLPSSCLAVGSYQTTTQYRGLTVTESGGHFTAAAFTAFPAGADLTKKPFLNDVSCVPNGTCGMGAQLYLTGHSYLSAFDAIRSGGKWTAALVTLPATALSTGNSYLMGVSCTGTGHCTAVGTYQDASGGYPPLATSTG